MEHRKGETKMKVWEFRNILADEQDYVLIDNETCEEITEDKDTDTYDNCEVLEIRGHSIDFIALYINRPTERYSTYLDVTYSIMVEADVPVGCKDINALFQAIGEEKINQLPSSFTVNGITWDLVDNNMQSGSFYDMIEGC